MEHSLSEFQASSAAMISGVGGGRGGVGWPLQTVHSSPSFQGQGQSQEKCEDALGLSSKVFQSFNFLG